MRQERSRRRRSPDPTRRPSRPHLAQRSPLRRPSFGKNPLEGRPSMRPTVPNEGEMPPSHPTLCPTRRRLPVRKPAGRRHPLPAERSRIGLQKGPPWNRPNNGRARRDEVEERDGKGFLVPPPSGAYSCKTARPCRKDVPENLRYRAGDRCERGGIPALVRTMCRAFRFYDAS